IVISDDFYDPLCRPVKQQPLAPKCEFSSGKIIIGIDTTKGKQQVRIIDSNSIHMGKAFSLHNINAGQTDQNHSNPDMIMDCSVIHRFLRTWKKSEKVSSQPQNISE
ncbi:MAG: hypothetical protein KAT07_07090, partial [Calditrichia bacterium]|nr:hypothetical protein [Calditrichia bacterium]